MAMEKIAPIVAYLTGRWPGALVCLTIACAATFLSGQYGGPQLLYALLIGLAFHFLHSHAPIKQGIDFCARTLLRAGVALLGARITLDQVSQLGVKTALVVTAALCLTIIVGIALARLMSRRVEEGLISGCSVAICGASAAIAVAAVLPQSRENERITLLTVVGVTVFSTIAMIAYPFMLQWMPFTNVERGVFLGGTIHDVAQVVAAGMLLGPEAADTATVVKLFRVLLLVPVVLVICILYRKLASVPIQEEPPTQRKMPMVPTFLLVFIALVIGSSLNIWTPQVAAMASEISRWLLVVAIAAVGVKTSFQDLCKLGWQPVLMLLCETVFIAAFVMLALVYWR